MKSQRASLGKRADTGCTNNKTFFLYTREDRFPENGGRIVIKDPPKNGAETLVAINS